MLHPPKLKKVVGLDYKKLVATLLHCPFSDYYGASAQDLVTKFPTAHLLRKQTELKVLQWETLRAQPDISEH